MSDGGDGFGEVLNRSLEAEPRFLATMDAAHRPCQAAWWYHCPSGTAIIESAQVIGLALLPQGRYHPFELDTFGLGGVLQDAASHGARRCLVGIGGSSTNDGGFGLARALGWRFVDQQGAEIQRWTDLAGLRSLSPPPSARLFAELIVAVDVQNILLGPLGCTRIYGPQKGLRERDFPRAERCLAQLADAVARQIGAFHNEPGTGAAGGLGFGLRAFAGARIEAGFEVFASLARVRERMRMADLVITGEGAIDESSLMGKGVGEIARWCGQLRVPCIGLCGRTTEGAQAAGTFSALAAIVPELASAADAEARAAFWLERLAASVAGKWSGH